MQPYVIKQGDYLALLAHRFGFDADTVWNDAANDALRQARPDPNILFPTDILYIPDQVDQEPVMLSLNMGTTNNFVAPVSQVSVKLRFVDPPFASQGFTIQELPELTGLTTGADGSVTFPIPVTLETFTIAFTGSGATFDFKAGHLDPIGTLSGVLQRLQNLGYIGLVLDGGTGPDIHIIRDALRAFKAAQSVGTPPADASSPSTSAPDNAGLDDEGNLDDASARQLVAAHGS